MSSATPSPSELRQLAPSVAHRLSSGQVITSASSAVKELLENALDAGANTVQVALENFGLDKIVVSDDGHGMTEANLKLAAAKHCTSKIGDFADLSRLSTFGFRGEALSACCDAGEVEVASRTEDQKVGSCVAFDREGNVAAARSVPMNRGTVVTVANIFARLPVRRKIQEKDSKKREELKKVERLCCAYGIIKPTLRIILRHKGSTIFQKSPVAEGDLRASSSQCLPYDVTSNLVQMKMELDASETENAMTVDMLIPRRGCLASQLFKTNPDRTFVFVNERPVNDKGILKMLKQIVGQTANSHNKCPAAVISIRVTPSCLDANLEPNKQNVLIQGYDGLLKELEKKLSAYYGLGGDENTCGDDSLLFDKEAVGADNAADVSQSSNEESSTLCDSPDEEDNGPMRPGPKRKVMERGTVVLKSLKDFQNTSCKANDTSENLLENDEILSPWNLEDTGEKSKENLDDTVQSTSSLKQTDLMSWSRGKLCTDMEALEPTRLVRGYEPPEKKARKEKVVAEISNQRLDKFLQKMETKRKRFVGDLTLREQAKGPLGTPVISRRAQVRILRKAKDVRFDIALTGKNAATPEPQERIRREVVGRLRESQHWLCRVGERLCLLNHHRAEEAELFDRLLSTRKLPCPTLSRPREVRLAEDQAVVLRDLVRRGDERLAMSGIRVVFSDETPDVHEIVGAAPVIESVAKAELTEILQLIMHNPDELLKSCRPPKVRAFLQSEAVRMVRQSPPGIDRAQADVYLRNELFDVCPHQKPILEDLCVLK